MTTFDDADPLVGRVLDGRYQIIRRLARGGMAVVYLATDQRLARTVAVKVMHESLCGDPGFATRFDREARAVARLSHPNVVSVFDQGVDNGRPYIVMEYVEGQTLRQVMSRERAMPPQRALDLMLPIAAAVAAAHDAGIIHRDLKPENVLISARGQVKVADFGLARAVTAHTATATGTLIGTVSYIAPELVTEGKGDTHADIYALGVVLYEMLTGLKPHTGDNPIQVAYSHVHNEIGRPSAAAPWPIPDYVDALVTSAAARDPRRRPADGTAWFERLSLARSALARGIANDPALAARIATGSDPTEQVTQRIDVDAMEANGTEHTMVVPESTPVAPDFAPSTADSPPQPPSQPAKATAASLRQRRKRRHKRGLAALLIVLLATALVGWGAWYAMVGRFVPTPALAGLTQARAQVLADQSNVVLTFENAYSEDVPPGQVIGTKPAAGTPVERGATIVVTLSRGPERYAVPKVVGLTRDDAIQALKDAHLECGEVTNIYDDKIPRGKVISASLKAGTMVKPDTTVDLNISEGPAPVTVVDYTGKPLGDAQNFFTQAGLKVKVTKKVNDKTIPKDSIVSQTPKDGELPRGGTVKVVVSLGPKMIAVPQVRGLSTAQAKQKLEEASFHVTISSISIFGQSLVLGTSPAAGTKVPEGSTVKLMVG